MFFMPSANMFQHVIIHITMCILRLEDTINMGPIYLQTNSYSNMHDCGVLLLLCSEYSFDGFLCSIYFILCFYDRIKY